MIKITVENEDQIVMVQKHDKGADINADDLAALFYTVMLALEYHPETARSVFSEEVGL